MSSRLFVISAPSGAGKTTLVRALLARVPGLRVSISHTTRQRRPTEQEGREYYFVERPAFERLRDAGAFLEHAEVFGNLYGTSRPQLEEKLAAGHDVILEIDWQGARQARLALPGCQTIFVLPPSREILQRRLVDRQTDSPEVIQRRLSQAVADMSHYREFDYTVVNDELERAVTELAEIVAGRGEPYRSGRAALAPVLANLLDFPTP
jgi:guanylate kinase